jgi:Alpha/beta hydrolase family
MAGILLIHGGGHGPWCWDGFVSRLASRGQVHAVQLRGHDGSPRRIWHRVHHYLDDVQRAAARFAAPRSWSATPWAGCWRRNTWSFIPPQGRC